MAKKLFLKNLALTGAALTSTLAFSPAVASAQSSTQTYRAELVSLNNSGATGLATVKVAGNKVTVTIQSTGLSANLPHAQHIYIGGKNVCPTMSAGSKVDGVQVLSTVQGQPSYGSVKVSLTTSGNVDSSSAFTMNDYPKANSKGDVTYSRTFTLPSGVTASDVANGVIVQHGVASIFGSKTNYDGSAKSQLDKSLPLEETVPADCGKLVSATVGGRGGGAPTAGTSTPTGAPNTGSGSTAGIQDPALFAIGGAAIAAAGVTLIYRRKLATATSHANNRNKNK